MLVEKAKKYHGDNRDKVIERKRRYYAANRINSAEYSRDYYQRNRPKLIEYSKGWRSSNTEKTRAQTAKRRAARRERIPPWFGELDQFVLEEAYDLAIQRQELTGIEWHVDHMVPLQAKKACGLHCAGNIQVIPAVMNLSKSNKMLLTEPLAWLR